MRADDLMPIEDDRPWGVPVPPFRVDQDGDIVDAEGWLVCCPACDVWRYGDRLHAERLCQQLNAVHATPPSAERNRG